MRATNKMATKKATVKIADVKFVKDGMKNGRSWELHRVTDSDGVDYATFTPGRYINAMNDGRELDIAFTEEQKTLKNGNKVWNRTLVEPKDTRQPAKPNVVYSAPMSAHTEEMLTILRQVKADMEEIKKWVGIGWDKQVEKANKELRTQKVNELPPL